MTSVRKERQQRLQQIDIYPVTCEALSAGRRDEDVLEAVAVAGAKIIQLRDKSASRRALYEKALRFRDRTRAHNMLLIINDHLDIALAVEADGVHLGQDDLPLDVARTLFPDGIVGISTHAPEEAKAAAAGGADYINIGPIFSTQTKDGLHTFVGPEMISRVTAEVSLPFTVMGGIKADNIDQVLAAGARHIAVVTAITAAEDMVAATRDLRARINSVS